MIELITKDNEVDKKEKVIVKYLKEVTSLQEELLCLETIDKWILDMEAQILALNIKYNEMKNLRSLVETEALKVKLKGV